MTVRPNSPVATQSTRPRKYLTQQVQRERILKRKGRIGGGIHDKYLFFLGPKTIFGTLIRRCGNRFEKKKTAVPFFLSNYISTLGVLCAMKYPVQQYTAVFKTLYSYRTRRVENQHVGIISP